LVWSSDEVGLQSDLELRNSLIHALKTVHCYMLHLLICVIFVRYFFLVELSYKMFGDRSAKQSTEVEYKNHVAAL